MCAGVQPPCERTRSRMSRPQPAFQVLDPASLSRRSSEPFAASRVRRTLLPRFARAFPGNSCAKGISAFPFASALQVYFRNKRISACPFASALQVSFCVRRNPLAGSPFERNVKKVCRRPRNLSFCFTRHTNCSAYVLCEVGIGISGCKRDGATRVRPRRRWPAHPRLAQDAAEPIGTRWHGRMVDGWSSDHMPPV